MTDFRETTSTAHAEHADDAATIALVRTALAQRAGDVTPEATRRIRAHAYRPRHSFSRRAQVAAGGVVGLAGTAGVAASLIGFGASASPAFAGWTATPAHASTGQVAAAQRACRAQLDRDGGAGASDGYTARLTDVRGPFTVQVLGNGSSDATCFTTPDFTVVQTVPNGDGAVTSATVGTGAPGSDGGPGGGPHTMQSSSVSSNGDVTLTVSHLENPDGKAYTLVSGSARAGVTGARITRTDGTTVAATVQGGVLAAWWPGKLDVDSTRVTTPAGTTTEPNSGPGAADGHALPPLPAAPACPATADQPCTTRHAAAPVTTAGGTSAAPDGDGPTLEQGSGATATTATR